MLHIGGQSGSWHIIGLPAQLCKRIQSFFSAWHIQALNIFKGCLLITGNNFSSSMFVDKHAHMCTSECFRFVEPHCWLREGMFRVVSASQACVPYAGLSKQTWRGGGQDRATAAAEPGLPQPHPVNGELYSFLITTIPMATPLYWLFSTQTDSCCLFCLSICGSNSFCNTL